MDAVRSMQPLPIPFALTKNADSIDASTLQVPVLDESPSPSESGEQTTSIPDLPMPTTSPKLDHNELRKRAVDQHTVPWGLQTGLTKYAPTPKRAGSTIKSGSPTPQYPPFPFQIATTYLGLPTVQYTDNAYLTPTAPFVENPVRNDERGEAVDTITNTFPMTSGSSRFCANGGSKEAGMV